MIKVNFAGTTEECLQHLIKDGNGEEHRKVFVDVFLSHEISRSTIRRWLKGTHFPKGLNLVYLKLVLKEIGYTIEELIDLSSVMYEVGRILYEKKCSVQEIVDMIGMPRDALVMGLSGKRVPGEERLQLLQMYMDEIKGSKDESCENVKKDDIPVVKSAENSNILSADGIVNSFCLLMDACTPMAEAILSDDFTPEQRRHVRERFGRKKLFRLSNVLDALCSEESRKNFVKE